MNEESVEEFREKYPDLLSASHKRHPEFRPSDGRPDVPPSKSSSINSRIFPWGAASALTAFLAVVWVEFGLLASAGTFLVVAVALIVWVAREFNEAIMTMRDEPSE